MRTADACDPEEAPRHRDDPLRSETGGQSRRRGKIYSAVVRILFLKYLWVHSLVATFVPSLIVAGLLDGEVGTFFVPWFVSSALLTWLVGRLSTEAYERNVSVSYLRERTVPHHHEGHRGE